MELFEKHVLDMVEVINSTGVIQVRFLKQKWVRSGDQEMMVEANSGFHRMSLNPGDWVAADSLGVRSYADIAWTPEVITAWQAQLNANMQKLWSRESSQ